MKKFLIPASSLYGISHLDDQHQGLFDIVGLLSSHVDTASLTEVEKLFTNFQIQLQQHFNDEESMMKEVSYPEVGSHSYHHGGLLKTAQKIIDEVKTRDKLIEDDIHEIVDKILRHMLVEDGLFNTHLRCIQGRT